MKRFLILVYGLLCYPIFLASFLWSVWFVWTMDTMTTKLPWRIGILIDAGLLSAFALQHSVMARPAFKRVWTRVVPQEAERSTYVLFASLILIAIIVFWQPLPGTIWHVQAASGVLALNILFAFGWLVVLVCTFLIDHFDLFGLKQVWRQWRGVPYEPPKFRTPGPYRLVRHPLYLGFTIAFWSAPLMTSGHLFFAIMCTGYMLVAIQFEEHDLITYHGEDYKAYRSGVSMIVPWPHRKKQTEVINR